MENELEGRRGPRRRVNRMRELERRIARLEDELGWLRRAVEANGEDADAVAVGPCPTCGRGVLVRRGSQLECSTCGYVRFL